MNNKTKHLAAPGHPIHTLMEEHNRILGFATELISYSKELEIYGSFQESAEILSKMAVLVDHIKSSQLHYIREENVIFPYLEKSGVNGPPAQMWAEHDQIRETEKELFQLFQDVPNTDFTEFTVKLKKIAIKLSIQLEDHYFKENNMLFPMALQYFSDAEWKETTKQFAEIGYCTFTPKSALGQMSEKIDLKIPITAPSQDNKIDTLSGKLSKEQLISMLNTLPVEITFVNKDDTFTYFNKVKDPIFVRTEAAIGTKVQNCHPMKSVHMVNKILSDFKSGAKDEVSFWISLGEKFVYIRYFALRDSKGEYLGCMEATMDIKGIQEITGEKRLV